MYATAPAPTRATTSITLSAGLLNIPLSLYTSTQPTRVERKEFLSGDVSVPVGRSPIRKDTGAVVETGDVTRMAEATNGTWVVLTDDEIAASTSDRGVAEIVSFVSTKDFDNYLTEGLYQARPNVEKGKANPAATKAFGLLLAGMKARKVGALVKLAMRGPARYAILTTDGDLLMILTADAVRQPLPIHLGTFSKPEVALATDLIDAIGIESPAVTDETAPVVQAYVDAKAGGAAPKAAATAPAATDDLMAALQASIDAAKAAKAAA
jgi:non-homologous end joining protein Ku